MKKKLLFTISLFILMIISVTDAKAQNGGSDSTKTYLVVKNDGTELIGKILSDDGREVLLLTEAMGKIFIPKSDIKSIKVIENKKDIVSGQYIQAGPFSTRYAFTTNALPIVKGENYALINLYGPEVHFALSNQFSLGVMSTWIASPLILAAKYSFKTNNELVNFSVGTLIGSTGYLNNFRGYAGLHFANVTYGTRAKNITFSAGYAYLKTGSYNYERPLGSYTYNSSIPSSHYPIEVEVQAPINKGPMFSIAGIVKVGVKASFVFDSMLGIFSTELNEENSTLIQQYTQNQPEIRRLDVTRKKVTTSLLFIMPGMRFQATDKKAFQFNLAGVSVKTQDNSFSFPLPMLTWFYGF